MHPFFLKIITYIVLISHGCDCTFYLVLFSAHEKWMCVYALKRRGPFFIMLLADFTCSGWASYISYRKPGAFPQKSASVQHIFPFIKVRIPGCQWIIVAERQEPTRGITFIHPVMPLDNFSHLGQRSLDLIALLAIINFERHPDRRHFVPYSRLTSGK